MTRARVDRLTLSKNLERFLSFKSSIAALLSLSLVITPAFGSPSSSLGTIVYADRAHVGTGVASVGATVFGGDRLSTEGSGGVQIRTGAARLQLSGSSIATLSYEDSNPAATLTAGSATFSTANAKAFALHVGTAVIRPSKDDPTIGRITMLGPKEFIVKSTRGALTIAVEDDVREIPEGMGYRIILDTSAAPAATAAGEPQGPAGAGTKGYGGPPVKAATSKFIWYAIAVAAVVTFLAVQEVLESPDRP